MSYIDTRDLAQELDELEARQDAATEVENDPDATDEDREALDPLDEDEAIRLAALRDLADEVGDEWRHGATMIPVSEFRDYAEELADDLGLLKNPEGQSWPYTHIDWDAAADELRSDYTEVAWDGDDYLVRL